MGHEAFLSIGLVIVDDVVVAASVAQAIVGLDVATGTERWRTDGFVARLPRDDDDGAGLWAALDGSVRRVDVGSGAVERVETADVVARLAGADVVLAGDSWVRADGGARVEVGLGSALRAVETVDGALVVFEAGLVHVRAGAEPHVIRLDDRSRYPRTGVADDLVAVLDADGSVTAYDLAHGSTMVG